MKLKVVSGPKSGEQFTFDKPDVFLFGRSPDCHCCLPDDPYISRHHFMLEVNPPESRIRDLGSLNGTFINDIKYGGREENESQEEAAKLNMAMNVKNGDEIRVGKSTLKVQVKIDKQKEDPAFCFKCGKKIPASRKEEQAYLGGTYLCQQCRIKLVAPPPPPKKVEEKKSGGELLEDLLNVVFGKEKAGFPEIPGYQIIQEVGRGGFGKVFLAKRKRDGKDVALKVMLARKRSVNQKDVKRFQREMNVCKSLNHPNIVCFEDQGYVKGMFYFTMEYCLGGSLQDFMNKKGVLDYNIAVPIILQVLDGLEYAHKKKFVHRDLKPGNILFSDQNYNVAKITDFGMAKNFQQAGLSGFTGAGEYAGTPPFMPKEQLLDFKHVRPVSDIFSIGATLYYMLTGSYVYDFHARSDPIRVILEDRIVPIKKRRLLPKKLVEVIDKSISPEAKKRYQKAAEMKKDLQKAMKGTN